ncbi:hypothetical protein COCON_G00012500 [Conger conger]|uniref:Uncharacterized protein n=1 Tax=Conger conger TaxID=82655 RepID=A0A9Q1E2Q4_CONCO|nr:hypothetical protein COCON_G00012500 [Conger conger]
MEPAHSASLDMVYDPSIHLARMWRLEQITAQLKAIQAIQATLLGPHHIQFPFKSLIQSPILLLSFQNHTRSSFCFYPST